MKKKVIKFLFPIPSIVITLIFSVLMFDVNFNNDIRTIPIIVFSIIIFYIIIVIPLNFIIYIIKKTIGFIKNIFNRKNECNSNNNVYNFVTNDSSKKTEDNITNENNKYTLSPEESIKKVKQLENDYARNKYYEKIYERKSFIECISDEVLKEPAIKIQEMYKNFGIDILISKIHISMNQIFYIIVPMHGIRSNTLFSFKDDISVLLGTKVEMEALPKEGGIGVFIPIEYFMEVQKPYNL